MTSPKRDKARQQARGGFRAAVVAATSRHAVRLASGSMAVSLAGPALASGLDQMKSMFPDAVSAFGLSSVVGLSVFAATTAILHIRERSRWDAREAALTTQKDKAIARAEEAEIFGMIDDQVTVRWASPSAIGEIHGNAEFLLYNGTRLLPLAFGSWVVQEQVKDLGSNVDQLKLRGEPFEMGLHTRDGRFVEARGRAVSGRAVLHLREVSQTRRALLELEAERNQLSLANQHFTAMLNSSPNAIWLRSADGKLKWANAAYLAAAEAISLEEAVRLGTELMDREERANAANARARGESFAVRAPTVIGGQRRFLDLAERVTPHGFAGHAVDITEMEDLRADLARQMQAHVKMLDRLPTAVAVFDARQRLSYRNLAYEKLWSLEPAYLDTQPSDGEILDRLRTERRLPEAGGYKDWKAERLKAYTALETSEDWWYLPDSRAIQVTTSPSPQGGVIQLFDDATERFSLESKVNALSRTQRETLDGLREGVAVFGSDGRLRLSNPAFAALWKLSPALLEAHPHIDDVVAMCRLLCPAEDAWSALRAAVVGVRDRREDYASRMLRQDGSVLDCALAPLPDGSTLLTFADSTDTVNFERALTERNEALVQSAQLRDNFVHHVSYALRSPLTTIIGFAQLIGEEIAGPLNPRQREYAQLILRSSGTLLTIINDILDLASIDNDELELELEVTDVASLVASAARGLEERLSETGITLHQHVAPDAGTMVCDAKRLRQALYNLMSNAVGFSQSGQNVELSASRDGPDIVFKVIDQGRGIPQDIRGRVFERFETHTLGSRHRGIGLGLAIVRSFVALHGGTVDIESQPGVGTTVTCRVPAESRPFADAAE
ncbi:MAG: ATP-binding protein [Bosea sp. (in: a-proteobacteria)]